MCFVIIFKLSRCGLLGVCEFVQNWYFVFLVISINASKADWFLCF